MFFNQIFLFSIGFLRNAKKQLEEIKAKSSGTCVAYNGADISILIRHYLTVAITLHHQAIDDELKYSSKTRSGGRFRPASPPEVSHDTEQTETGMVHDFHKNRYSRSHSS